MVSSLLGISGFEIMATGGFGLLFAILVWALVKQGQGKAVAELKAKTLEKTLEEANAKIRRERALRQHPDLAERLRNRNEPK